ncbi:hypothetical protein [Pseudoroseicyclus tamaricis]|uniref:Transmembrane protein n=1 Tax=Pseudoroseicyclus tamaricis TaxID=2705421 RepID=A0A6B2JUI4_9RHOB|nr:hypothetical protein [Pseudoroseicyclus tamaricis]NDV01585.1 hypothetical protein [Pseudoroseicyclus tamaricis]
MPRSRLVTLHAVSSSIALLTILSFWLSATIAELFLGHDGIVSVRTAILFVLPVLVIALAGAGASGFRLAGRSRAPEVEAKRTRMKVAAGIGVLVLVPSAIFLGWKANAGSLDTTFTTVQLVELVAGATNIVLLGLNMRTGLRMRGRRLERNARRAAA